jgi:hypothetical protein
MEIVFAGQRSLISLFCSAREVLKSQDAVWCLIETLSAIPGSMLFNMEEGISKRRSTVKGLHCTVGICLGSSSDQTVEECHERQYQHEYARCQYSKGQGVPCNECQRNEQEHENKPDPLTVSCGLNQAQDCREKRESLC